MGMNRDPEDQHEQWDLYRGQPWNEPDTVSENERILGGLCYVSQIVVPLVLPIILLLTQEGRRSLFVRYHAVHSVALLVLTVLYYLAATFAFVLLGMISRCLICVAWILFLPPAIALLFYGWQAFVGRALVIPYVTRFLDDNGWL